jgi:hypothetical protein
MGDMNPNLNNSVRNIVILTGAGISAESGIDTFRSEGGQGTGLWERHRVEDVATPEGFARDPDLVLKFYDMRRAAIQTKLPNRAHEALARLDAAWDGDLLIVTQNVDDLHAIVAYAWRASERLVHRLRYAREMDRAADQAPTLPRLQRAGTAPGCRLVWRNALPHGRNPHSHPQLRLVCFNRHFRGSISGVRSGAHGARSWRADART